MLLAVETWIVFLLALACGELLVLLLRGGGWSGTEAAIMADLVSTVIMLGVLAAGLLEKKKWIVAFGLAVFFCLAADQIATIALEAALHQLTAPAALGRTFLVCCHGMAALLLSGPKSRSWHDDESVWPLPLRAFTGLWLATLIASLALAH